MSINEDISTYRKIKYLKGPRSQDSCIPNGCTTLKVYFNMSGLILISYWRYVTFSSLLATLLEVYLILIIRVSVCTLCL